MSRYVFPIQPTLVPDAAGTAGCKIGNTTYYYRKSYMAGGIGVSTNVCVIYIPASNPVVTQVKIYTACVSPGGVPAYSAGILNYVMRTDTAQAGGVPTQVTQNNDVSYAPLTLFNPNLAGTAGSPAYITVTYVNATATAAQVTSLITVSHMTFAYSSIPPILRDRGSEFFDSLNREDNLNPYTYWSDDTSVCNYRCAVIIPSTGTTVTCPPFYFKQDIPSTTQAVLFIALKMSMRSPADGALQAMNLTRLVYTSVNRGLPVQAYVNTPFGGSSMGLSVTYTPIAGTTTTPPYVNMTVSTTSNTNNSSLEFNGITLCANYP